MLLGANNNILLSDFGLALMADEIGFQRTRVEGTMSYMSPEQIRGRPCPASDLYSLGVVVYAWLSGYLPFYGNRDEIARQHMYTSPPSLCEMVSGMPPAVERVVRKALEKDPKRRFASVGDFSTALEQASMPVPVVEISNPPSFRYRPAHQLPNVAIYRKNERLARLGRVPLRRQPGEIPQQRIVASPRDLGNPSRRVPRRQW